MAEIPAETAYLASSPNNAVCKGWVVVDAGICEPVSQTKTAPRDREPKTFKNLQGNFSF